jgi:hypothetical protein
VRFEPGDHKRITLVDLGGDHKVYGLNALTSGPASQLGGHGIGHATADVAVALRLATGPRDSISGEPAARIT